MTTDADRGILLSSMSTFDVSAKVVMCARRVCIAGRGVLGGVV